ncbi:MAG: hypothetical protein II284_03110 [Clostridia bacterium]|nr:hypothetical protein [Clostridia bacterium]
MDCTRRQAVIFAGVLRWLRNVGIREANKRGTGNHSHRQPERVGMADVIVLRS